MRTPGSCTGNGVAFVRISGEVDLATAPGWAVAMRRAIADARGLIVLDLTEVSFFSAAGVHIVLEARDLATATGQRLRVVLDQRGVVAHLLSLAGLTATIRVVANFDAVEVER
jgi:anti-sigma B factor antagonist